MEIVEPRHEADWKSYIDLLFQSLGGGREYWEQFVHAFRDHSIVRLAVDGELVLSGAAGFPLPQLFGDRPVPSLAVSGVGSLPEAQKRGLATAVVEAVADAGRSEGAAVSALWPSTTRFYRRMGWEVAGHNARNAVPTRSLTSLTGSGEARRDPGPDVREAQRQWARRWNGALLRSDWYWLTRHFEPLPERTYRYGWYEEGEPTGFLSYRLETAGPEAELWVTELWSTTPGGWRGLLGLLGSHQTMVPTVRFGHTVLPHDHDLMWLLPEQDATSQSAYNWMLRLLDIPAALEARGWSPHASGHIELQIEGDGKAPPRLVLEVEKGEARVSPGGSGRITIGARGLAAWYAGGLSAVRAARLGLVNGESGDLEGLDALLDHRPAYLPDSF